MTFKFSHRPPIAISPVNIAVFSEWIGHRSADSLRAASVSLFTPLGAEDVRLVSLPPTGAQAFDRLMAALEPELRELAMIREGERLFVDVVSSPVSAECGSFTFSLLLTESPFDQGQRVDIQVAAV